MKSVRKSPYLIVLGKVGKLFDAKSQNMCLLSLISSSHN